MQSIPIRVYADTSAFGGVFDSEYSVASRAFIAEIDRGSYELVISPLVRDEIATAPPPVRDLFQRLRKAADYLEVSPEVSTLQQAYLRARIIPPKWEADALHVALATVGRCAAIVSWNFRHIVNFRLIPLYNGVNQSLGYGVLAIHTPQEMRYVR